MIYISRKHLLMIPIVLLSLLLLGCSDMSTQQQQQITSTGTQSGASFYQQQGETFGRTLSNQLGTAFGDMP